MTHTTEMPGARPDASLGAVAAANALKARLGTWQVAASMLAALGPLLVPAGTLPLAFAATGVTAVPGACLVIAAVLIMFIVGYLAMSRHIGENSGAFYAMVGRGLGRPLGVVAGWGSILGYTLLQVSLAGFLGSQLAAFTNAHWGWSLHWWAWALIVWAVVLLLGLNEINLSAKVLAVLSVTEVVIVLVTSAMGLLHPASGYHLGPFNPARISWAGFGPITAVLMLCFVGIEHGPVYGPESRNPKRTVLVATIISVLVSTVIYVLSSWAMVVFYGKSITQVAGPLGANLFADMGHGPVETAVTCLIMTGSFAAWVAFYNTSTRYDYSGGRDHLLPAFLAKVNRNGVPWAASLLQAGFSLLAIGLTQLFHWDPLTQLFYMASTFGGFVIMGLFALTAIAVVVFFLRDDLSEHPAVRLWLPVLSALFLLGMEIACAANLSTMFGVVPTDPTITRLYALLGAVVLLALAWSAYLWRTRPEAYRQLAGPDKSAAVRPVPAEAVAS